MAATSANFAKLLEPGLREVFDGEYDQIPSILPMIFGMKTSTKATEKDLSLSDFGEVPIFDGNIQFDEIEQAYEKTYTHEEYARGFKIERKLYDDDQYNVINRKPQGLAIAFARKREITGMQIFNNAFNTGYTGGDSKALCVSDHPSPVDGVADQDNAGDTAFSHTALIATRTLMKGYKSLGGNKIWVNPDTVICPRDMEGQVWEVIKSSMRTDTTMRIDNFAKGRFDMIVGDYLEDANNWFMVDSRLMKMYFLWFDRIKTEFFKASEFETLIAKYAAYARWVCGWSDWRPIYGHEVS